MKKMLLYSLFLIGVLNSCSKDPTIPSIQPNENQIIADHTIIDDFEKIPTSYLEEVKKMMICFPGESHAGAYRRGMELLELMDPVYSCNVSTGESYTDQYVRVNYTNFAVAEDAWFTWYAYPEGSRPPTSMVIKNLIKEYHDHDHPVSVIGFGWCWDMASANVSTISDPEYNLLWRGSSVGGPNGDRCWGLDAADYAITGNTVCMDTYLNTTLDYMNYCKTNGYNTKVVFTTGPVDTYTYDWAYCIYLKHQYIRNFVAEDPERVLFDYADILSYDEDGTTKTDSYNGHTFPIITDRNLGDASVGHIGPEGAIRLAKAQWWLMARLAGWDGVSSSNVPITDITISGAGGLNTINRDNGTLQLNANVLPSNATNKSVSWTIISGTENASINTLGLVTAKLNGTVVVLATANDGSGVSDTFTITISGQIIPVTSISISGKDGINTITEEEGTLQLLATVLPSNATNKSVTWSIINVTGQASITSVGLVTAIENGLVKARAIANDGTGTFGLIDINIINQSIHVQEITITSAGRVKILSIGDTLHLSVRVLPDNATNKEVFWTVENLTGSAFVSEDGLLTAQLPGKVIVNANSIDNPSIKGTIEIEIFEIYEPLIGVLKDGKILIKLDSVHTSLKCSLIAYSGIVIDSKIINEGIIEFDIGNFPAGLYIIIISHSSQIINYSKIVVL